MPYTMPRNTTSSLRAGHSQDAAEPRPRPAVLGGLLSSHQAKLSVAHSLWFRDDDFFTVERDFLQTNANFYQASAYQADFDSPETLKDINRWVEEQTDGMIDRILEEIDPSAVMFLINAMAFDALWETPYPENDVRKGDFTTGDGQVSTVPFMYSAENVLIQAENAKGFVKKYKGGQYEFVALLPEEGVALHEYVQSMTGTDFLRDLQNTSSGSVMTGMPKFSYEYEITLNNVLRDMGMPSAFDPGRADLSRLGRSDRGNLYIGRVLHKTFIAVDELGTKAGAATAVEVVDSGIPAESIILDRPFVYAIVDSVTKLPVFMGTVDTVQG